MRAFLLKCGIVICGGFFFASGALAWFLIVFISMLIGSLWESYWRHANDRDDLDDFLNG